MGKELGCQPRASPGKSTQNISAAKGRICPWPGDNVHTPHTHTTHTGAPGLRQRLCSPPRPRELFGNICQPSTHTALPEIGCVPWREAARTSRSPHTQPATPVPHLPHREAAPTPVKPPGSCWKVPTGAELQGQRPRGVWRNPMPPAQGTASCCRTRGLRAAQEVLQGILSLERELSLPPAGLKQR